MSYNIVQKIYMGNNLIHSRDSITSQYEFGPALEQVIDGVLINDDLDILYGMGLIQLQIDCFLNNGPMYLVVIDKTNDKVIEDIKIDEFIKKVSEI